ncbi:MAG: hypothetical protein Q4C89_04915 [Deinococcus sp.]|uniref:type II toxin-antitoxin system VapC family toxin n=1 Tax=Deinococcus sp. TaxID=47478 RepID=UPI0026DDC4B7|nr:PIN domain-containing protein [Deinococcus sp.]MDO4245341.1 hypothetical protein [Deinococcus sp.]
MTTIELPVSCLIDTTYLVHLMNPKAEHHAHAFAYTQALQAGRTRFYLPTLVMAEYAVRGKREGVEAILGGLNPEICGFDMSAALRYAELTQLHPTIFKVPVPEKERSVIDLMLVAIADTLGVESVITCDKNICGQFRAGTSLTALDIRKPITELFPLWHTEEG